MTILELHQNESVRRKEFPVCVESIFLAHAGVCPFPHRVAQATTEYTSACTKGDQEMALPTALVLKTRKLAAELLGCTPQEIALVGPTSNGLSMVANGLDWQKGDNLVFYQQDFPSNAVVWMALASHHGVQLREVQPKNLGEITLEDITPLVDSRTRLVALSSAHAVSGYRLDIDRIGQWVRSKNALFCVDSVQTLGVLRTHVKHVDFLAADSHKWLLGPCAAGILFVRREVQSKLRPILVGWNNVICPGYITQEQVEFPLHAGRYEAGSHNLIGITGLHAALSLLSEFGIENIENTVLGFTRFLREELRKHGFQLANTSEAALSGITSFYREGFNMEALHSKLLGANIVTSLRQTHDGKKWIRFSPHFYNTQSELERALSLL